MTPALPARRSLLTAGAATAGVALATRALGLLAPVQAQGLAATPTMRGGAPAEGQGATPDVVPTPAMPATTATASSPESFPATQR